MGKTVMSMSQTKEKRSYFELWKIVATPFFNYVFAFYFVMLFTCYLIQAYIHEERLVFNGDLLNIGVYLFFFFVLRMGRSRGVFWVSYFFCKILFVLSSPFILSGILNPEYLDVAGRTIMISLMFSGFFCIIFILTYRLKYGSKILDKERENFTKIVGDREKKI
ncbi:MAG: hypothetical protein ACRC26_03260 [Bacteroidales bacterium]